MSVSESESLVKVTEMERDGSDRSVTSRSVTFEQQHDCRQQIRTSCQKKTEDVEDRNLS